MTFSNLPLRRSYDSGNQDVDIVTEFLEPVLGAADRYDRLAGYFNSGMLAASARGLGNFVLNGGSIRLVTSPQLSPSDFEAMKELGSLADRMQVLNACLRRGISGLNSLASKIESDHVAAMAWLLREERLEIRIAVPELGEDPQSLFHHKVGIVYSGDSDEVLSFSGSINETSAAWTKNLEDFKVFRSWNEVETDYLQDDLDLFSSYWSPTETSRAQVVALDEAIREDLISFAPRRFESLDLNRRKSTKVAFSQPESKTTKLRDYQEQAIADWAAAGYRGILAMATGTGKTKTAVGCYQRLAGETSKLVVVVTSPYQHIASQWATEFSNFRPVPLAGVNNWRQKLRREVDECRLGTRSNLVITVVQDTAANPEFLSMIRELAHRGFKCLLIGDEAHGLGAAYMRNALADFYDYRLGLSATPERYFDEPGTKVLEEYFGGDVFNFPIEDALKWRDPSSGARALCDYDYYPILVSLTDDEGDRYADMTEALLEAMRFDELEGSLETQQRVEKILRERAMILKKAEGKTDAFDSLIARLGHITQALVYCVDTAQMTTAMEVLKSRRITYRRFTGEEGTTPKPEFAGKSERAAILEALGREDIDVLVAMKCLDEGVDVPSAKTAFILASSGNPREFIQRRGRVLRPDGVGTVAQIFDFVVEPAISRMRNADSQDFELKLFDAELRRMEEFGRCARNSMQSQQVVIDMHLTVQRGNKA